MPHRTLTLAQADPEIWRAISDENARQEAHIELIASENYASQAVLAAQGSQLTNKYAEGYPGKRYYGGGEPSAPAGRPGPGRPEKVFDAAISTGEPPSWAPANQAGVLAALQPRRTL